MESLNSNGNFASLTSRVCQKKNENKNLSSSTASHIIMEHFETVTAISSCEEEGSEGGTTALIRANSTVVSASLAALTKV